MDGLVVAPSNLAIASSKMQEALAILDACQERLLAAQLASVIEDLGVLIV